ncbi:MAG: helix-turn-helix transcriptional regulator [Thermomonas sp.]
MRLGDSNKALTARLNQLLEGEALSRMALSKRIGVADGTLGRIRYGTANPTIDVIDKIARYFRISPWELLRPPDATPAASDDTAGKMIPGLQQAITALNPDQQQALLAMIRALENGK